MVNALVAAHLWGALVAGGVRHVIVSPGSRNTPLVLAAEAHGDRLTRHVIVDERIAAFVGLGIAKATGDPVVLIATSGSAGAHYLPAIVEAAATRVPLIAITADRPVELHGVHAPQTTPQRGMLSPHAQLFDLPALSPGDDPRWVTTVGAQAMSASRRGPVHLNVAFREPLWTPGEAPAPLDPRPLTTVAGAVGLSAAARAELRARVAHAERGVIVAGPALDPGSRNVGRAAALLAESLGWPLITDPLSGVRFGPTGATRITTADAILRTEVLAPPDVVIHFGGTPTSKPLYRWFAHQRPDELILVANNGHVHDPMHAATLLVEAPASAVAEALAGAAHQTPDAWLARWGEAEVRARQALTPEDDGLLWEGTAWRALLTGLPPGADLFVASSMAVRDLDTYGRDCRQLDVYANRGVNGIDGTIATATGVALVRTTPLVVVLGDLAALHDHASLVVARQLGVDLRLVVIDNDGGGIFELLPIAQHPTAYTPYFATPQGIDIGGLAAGAEVTAMDARRADALRGWLAAPPDGPRLVRVVTDRAQSMARRRAAWQRVATSLEELT